MSEEVDGHVIESYELRKRLGKGAYGIVWKAIDRKTSECVALKKIFDAFRNPTDAQRTFREIMFLKEFGRHPNIITLYKVLRANNDKDIYLTFEYMDTDLHNVIKRGTILKDIHRRYIMCQLFRAVRFLHSGNVLHRDLKPSNILLNTECRVKLADFGLARSLSQIEDYPEGQNMPELTEYVATRWYRSPEILLSAKRYTKGVDMWSLGCILGEMLRGKPLFPGTSTINQIERIMETIVKPSDSDIRSIDSPYAEPIFIRMPQKPRKPLQMLVEHIDPEAVDLIEKLLVFAPYKRINVDECLTHPYVLQFHSPIDEPALSYDVMLPLPDHIQLSVDDYRNKLYEIITMDKTSIKRIRHKKIETDRLRYSPNNKSPSNIPPHDENPTGKQAPIAESECSDVEFDTSRSLHRHKLNCMRNLQNGNVCRHFPNKGRAQSADSPHDTQHPPAAQQQAHARQSREQHNHGRLAQQMYHESRYRKASLPRRKPAPAIIR